MSEETTTIQTKEVIFDGEGKQAPALIVIHGADIGKKFDLNKAETTIGRSDHCDIQINEENVSRNHARVLVGSSDVIIHDEGSTNGTFVNTRRVPSAALKDGDLILIGNTILKFVSTSSVESNYHEAIYRLATLDGLTQVFNKKYLLDKLESEFLRSRRYCRDLAVIIFDFDHFKKINDQYGHPAGDYILQRTASVIMKNMRKEDIFGRYGGEEFLIVLPETKLANASRLADKLRLLIQSLDYSYQKLSIRVTISCGVAALSQSMQSCKELIDQADGALYQAKRGGRNRVISAGQRP